MDRHPGPRLRWLVAGRRGVISRTLTNGTGINQANKVFQDHGATGTTYDLDAGTLLDPLGAVLPAFSRIICVMVLAPITNTLNVAVGGDFILSKYLTGWVDDAVTIPVHPGGCLLWIHRPPPESWSRPRPATSSPSRLQGWNSTTF